MPEELRLVNYSTGQSTTDTFHQDKQVGEFPCTPKLCKASLMGYPGLAGASRSKEEVRQLAQDFFKEFYSAPNLLNSAEHSARWEEVSQAIASTGTYHLTESELLFGAKLSWRNASRCIGRIQWSKLKLFDARHVKTARQMFEALCQHVEYATNGGNIRSTITVFPQREEGKQDFRMWNAQLISYAGYKNDDGTITGDPINVEFTKVCKKLGWVSEGTMWDILPLVVSTGEGPPEMFEYPPEIVLQVPLSHPTYEWFKDLGLRWYALPGVSSMMMDVAGVQFPAAPFNGWYMSTEVGCRDLCDAQRYNILEMVAAEMGEDTSNDATLWKDRTLVEVNAAVLHSFQQKSVTIVDHHTASENFMKHLGNEQRLRKGCPADWVWIVPPMSSSVTPVYHQEMAMYNIKPSFDYQTPAWKTYDWGVEPSTCKFSFKQIARVVQVCGRFYRNALQRRVNVTILYATETGKSQAFAEKLADIFTHGFNPTVCCMADYEMSAISGEALLLVVASTFGNGDSPENGIEFSRKLGAMLKGEKTEDTSESKLHKTLLKNVRYSVFALGSSVYPRFCAFGHHIDQLLGDLGAQQCLAVGEGDEMSGQQKSFRKWFSEVYPVACKSFGMAVDKSVLELELSAFEVKLTEDSVRFVPSQRGELLHAALSRNLKKTVKSCTVIRNTRLHEETGGGGSILVQVANDESYEPGDHVGVMPANRRELVDALLSRLAGTFEPDVVVKLQVLSEKQTGRGLVRTWSAFESLPTCSLRVLLTRFLDITSPPRSAQLEAMAALTSHQGHKARLLELATDPTKYDAWRNWRLPTVVDVLTEFPSVRIVPAMLVTILKPMLPRFYSISSSPLAHKGEIHLTVAVVHYKSEGGSGATRYGVCSNYLSNTMPGDQLHLFVRKAHNFALPLDVGKPIIMVGPGTGIAPFRGFWQHRHVQRQQAVSDAARQEFGKSWLFFGCRTNSVDLFRDEKEAMWKAGVLNRVYLALSREPTVPKTYVQSLLEKEGESVYRKLATESGHLYVCGDVGMAEGVANTLRVIVRRYGHLDEMEAEHFVKRLKEENRYHEDIFGVTTHATAMPTLSVSSGNDQKAGGLIDRVFCCNMLKRRHILRSEGILI